MEQILGSGFAILLGLSGVLLGLFQLRNRRRLNSWPAVPGKVIERGTYIPDIPQTTPPAFHYAPLVRYVYSVDGEQFESIYIYPKRILAPPTNKVKWAEKRAGSFPDSVTVRYNPEDPAEAFIEYVPAKWLYKFIFSFLVVAIFGFVVFLLAVLPYA